MVNLNVTCIGFTFVLILFVGFKLCKKKKKRTLIDKWEVKMWILDILRQLHTRVKNQEKADSETSAEWKEIKWKPGKVNDLILKTKGDLKEGPDNI